ncbi:glycosyltransferase family 4 protein [Candidatus Chloroploca sp. M-50]|uniref:Glycosyltransferase family 4 protein n=1 Tax=Candidatus Chloroploca mongolica TaxID=2528176 RepID=A0ABS4DAW0_9CHLR|nr:glycosyltransferase family 1 protein [Candidatus Chloroploca mongolica]MBP1466567.1 glycosyltransferase family 4 protein [Candidatus Chloroploca mongolica]
MHIAINAHLLAHTRSFRRAGVSHYIEQVLLHLGRLDRQNRYTVYTTRGLTSAALGLPPNFCVRPSHLPTINPRVRIPWEQLLAPLLLRSMRADLFHGVLNVAPLFCPVPSVITIHDLAFIRFPQTFRAYNRTYLDFATRLSARRASRILAVSEHTKREVVGLLGIPEDRIIVTPNAVRDHFRPPEPGVLAHFRARKGLPERFLLTVGTLEPRKNLTTLLDAYAQVVRTHQVPLLIGGGKGWLYDAVFQRLEALGLRDLVEFVGYIEEEELPLWYAAATVFVFPSIYEGFGMPPLEAMACGTPVITSASASLPEVVGDAGLMVNPHDAGAFAQAIIALLDDRALHHELRERGLRRAEAFSWHTTAERTLAAYEAAVRGF